MLGAPLQLSATVSYGTDVAYAWDFGDGSQGAGAIVSHTYAAAGAYTARVTATNELGSAATTLSIQITNAAPVADAGPGQTAFVRRAVTLDGRGSSDPDGHAPLSFQWTQVSGPAVELAGATTSQPSFVAPAVPAELMFRLVVTDHYGLASSPEHVAVTVIAFPHSLFMPLDGKRASAWHPQSSSMRTGASLDGRWCQRTSRPQAVPVHRPSKNALRVAAPPATGGKDGPSEPALPD